MKNAIKILILVLSIASVVFGVLYYAKTRVDPPIDFQPINQYDTDLNQLYSDMKKANAAREEDLIYLTAIDRIIVFESEKKLSLAETDKHKDKLIDCYSPIFLNRCFIAFDQPVWKEEDHKYMLVVSNRLRSVKDAIGKQVLKMPTSDSLDLVENIIAKYREAKNISSNTKYKGIYSTRYAINKANQYANDIYLSKCTDLRNALLNVRNNLAQSHYNYISSLVNKLSNYYSYSQQYYMNTLVNQVNTGVTEYDNNAISLYGSKEDVDLLWNRAKTYYNEAEYYYKNNTNYY